MIRSKRWVKDNMVLLGDAKATAHFSIGSGTKFAMEDAIALSDAMLRAPTVEAALKRLMRTGRREEVEKTQHAADVSLVWFEHVDRFWDFDPVQFAFGVMTRAKAITYDNLMLRAPEFVARSTAFARQVRAGGLGGRCRQAAGADVPAVTIARDDAGQTARWCRRCACIRRRRRADRFSSGALRIARDRRRRADFTEMTCVGREARITPAAPDIWNRRAGSRLARIVDFVHANSAARICLQLGHAGRKGATKLMWDGIDRPLEQGGWDVLSASPIPIIRTARCRARWTAPRWTRSRRSSSAAERGEACGFDMLELHCAHGYLLASFISPLTNHPYR
jgi:anthraniloyl-CoA monooxygenase